MHDGDDPALDYIITPLDATSLFLPYPVVTRSHPEKIPENTASV